LLIAQADGGALYPSETKPVYTLQSGPAGGVIASAQEGEKLEHPNVITTDVGGTSFDVGLVADGSWIRAREPSIGRFRMSLPMIEVESIGAAGGSLAWVDELGILHVGPKSAGANPGPVCYGNGGEIATLTDANVILGYLNPEYFLDGRMSLHRDKAVEAVGKVAKELDMSVEEAAAGIFTVANAQMASLLRQRVLARGYDPRDFALFAYGGGGAIHSPFYAAELGVKEVVVPALAGTFSAYGVAVSPLLHTATHYDFVQMPTDGAVFDSHLQRLEAEVHKKLDADNVPASERSVVYSVEMKYGSQVHTVRLEIPTQRYNDANIGEVLTQFNETYDRLFGKGAGFADAGSYLTSIIVEGYGTLNTPERGHVAASDGDAVVSQRKVYFDGAYMDTDIHRYTGLNPGSVVHGPAVIEAPRTTIVLPPQKVARLDDFGNVRIRTE